MSISYENTFFLKIQRYLSSFLIIHCLVNFSQFILYIFNPKEMKKIASSILKISNVIGLQLDWSDMKHDSIIVLLEIQHGHGCGNEFDEI